MKGDKKKVGVTAIVTGEGQDRGGPTHRVTDERELTDLGEVSSHLVVGGPGSENPHRNSRV